MQVHPAETSIAEKPVPGVLFSEKWGRGDSCKAYLDLISLTNPDIEKGDDEILKANHLIRRLYECHIEDLNNW